MRRRVFTTPAAERHISSIDEWWRANRPTAPALFLTELEHALEILAEMPYAGAPYSLSPIAGVRRLLLPRTRYHVYYVIVEETVFALAVWHATRESGPML